MSQLNKAEAAIKDFISHQGGQFTVKQANALRTVFEAIVDYIEEVEESIPDEEAPT